MDPSETLGVNWHGVEQSYSTETPEATDENAEKKPIKCGSETLIADNSKVAKTTSRLDKHKRGWRKIVRNFTPS